MKNPTLSKNVKSEPPQLKWAFFGTSRFAVILLDELKKSEILPSFIITTPDRPKGRNLAMTASPMKEWAIKENIPVLQPEKLNDPDFMNRLKDENWELFVVASYGKIIPKAVLDIPQNGSINIHPSLLPKYRGPSPIQSQILNEENNIGTTIIKMDEKMDHGPIVANKNLKTDGLSKLHLSYSELESKLAIASGELLKEVLHSRQDGGLRTTPQNEKEVTFTKIIEKSDGLIDLDSDPHQNYLRFLAYQEWPGTYFFKQKNEKRIRVVIKDAEYEEGKFNIKRVVPEGKKEMNYESFLNG